jgi:hypothetical protein
MIEPYPLAWPIGFPRNETPEDSSFKMTAAKSLESLLSEIKLLSGDTEPIISSNVPVKKSNGKMYSNVADDELHDSGVAVYFEFMQKQRVLACDKWKTPAENLRALALTVNAMRGLDRWGASAIIERAFTDLVALPEKSSFNQKSVWEILGLSEKPGDVKLLKKAYQERATKVHPDLGGSNEAFNELKQAYDQALKQYD